MARVRPTRDTTLMHTAEVFALRSSCSRLQVGAVFSINGRILVTGYNGTPSGMLHCDHTCDCPGGDPGDESFTRAHLDTCRQIRPCLRAVHAEANAISFAARMGVSLLGSELHVTASPCVSCAMLIINAGVLRVVFGERFRDPAGIDLLIAGAVQVVS